MSYQQTLAVDTVLIDEFRILGLLGSGGFANTYLAHDLTLGREVAIKEYFPSDLAIRVNQSERVEVKSEAQSTQFDWALKRFVREAKTLAKFRHPSVVRVFRVFNANDTAYIVLEFVRGSNMETWLKGLGRLPTQEEFDVLLPPLLDALEVVHDAGILHRDIKPANIYIRAADQTPVLLDFGAARYATSADLAGTTAAIVSKGYSPHEAYSTDSRLQGPWTDIYGLAGTIYRALTGSAPPESTTRVLDDSCVRAVDLPCAGQYRRDFLAGIDRALAVMPKDRPQSIGAWRHDMLADVGSQPKIIDANGEPETVLEWRPISVSPSSGRQISGASTGGTWRPEPDEDTSPPTRPPSQPGMSAVGASQRPTEIIGVSTAARYPSQPAQATRQAGSRNTNLMLGIALSVIGMGALASQYVMTGSSDTGTTAEVATIASPGFSDRGTSSRDSGASPVQPIAKDRDEDADAREKAAIEKREKERAEARRKQEEEQARLKAEAQARERELAEARRLRAEEEARRKAAAEKRERELAEARRKRAEEVRLKAEAEQRERERVEAQAAAEAEARRKAEAEKRERELAEARRQRELAEARAAAEKRKRELEEARRRQQEEEEAQKKAEAEKAEAEKAEADKAAQAQKEIQVAARTDGDAAGAGHVVVPSTEPSLELARGPQMKELQAKLKASKCYDGDVDGKLRSTQNAINSLEEGIEGEGETIDLASADTEDFDDWMNWFKSLEDIQCEDEEVEEPASAKSPAKVIRKRKKVKSRSSKPIKRRAAPKAKSKSRSRAKARARANKAKRSRTTRRSGGSSAGRSGYSPSGTNSLLRSNR